MIDWQEAYFDLVNKVECECVHQGDLVPIWQAFKDMADALATARAETAALREEVGRLREALCKIAPLLGYLPHPHCVEAIDTVRAALAPERQS